MRKFLFFIGLLAAGFSPSVLSAREPDPSKRIQRIAFGSCLQQNKPQPVWQAILQSQPDLFIFEGDNIYADTESPFFMKSQYDKLGANEGYKRLVQTVPLLPIWDDHDFGINDGGAEFTFKDKSKELFLDFFQIPPNAQQRKHPGLYASYLLGPQDQTVQIILLDMRYFRDPLVPSGKYHEYSPAFDYHSTMLGKDQWNWLEEELLKPAQIRFVVSSIQVVPEEQPFEKWANFPYERKKLFKVIKNAKAKGVIFLTGDRHLAEISVMDGGVGYPLYDFTSSSLNDSHFDFEYPEKNKYRLGSVLRANNFGLISISWKKPVTITLDIKDEQGGTRFRHEIPLDALQ